MWLDRSRTEDSLDAFVRDLKQVIDHLPSAVYVCDAPGGVIRLYNRRAVELWGRAPAPGDIDERFCGSFRLFRPDGAALSHAETPMAEVLRGGGARDEEIVIERPDGSRVTVHVNIAPFRDPDGRILGAVNAFQDVTGRKAADEALRLSEARYRAIVEGQPDLVCRFHPDGTLTFANEAYCRYFGFRREDVIGRRYIPIVHPDDLPGVEARVASLSPANRVVLIENRVLRGDGAVRWTQWANHAFYDDQGRLLELQSAGRDITERKQLEEDAARLAAIVASADAAILSKTLEGTIVSWNRAAERMFGYSAREAIGQPMSLIIPADRRHEEDEILRCLRRGDTIERFETERVTRAGTRVPVSMTVSPVRDAEGRITGASNISRDITEEKRAAEALRRSERELADFFDNAMIPVHWVGPDGTILRANKAELAMLGFTAEEYVGRKVGEFHVDPTVADDILRRLAADETIDNQPARLRGKDGSVRDVLIGSNALRENGRVIHTRCFTRDVTDVRRMEREREELLARERGARAQAEAANRAKDEFLAMLAHELRNPLSVIGHAVAVIERAGPLQPGPHRAGLVIRRQTDHLARLLDDLLDVARITSGHIELDQEPVDLRVAIGLAVDTHRHRIEGKRQHLAVTVLEEPLVVTGDAVRIQQVLGNLLNNASKYTPVGGSIRVTLGVEGGAAVLRVRDDGAGIPPDKLESIFDLFAQANPTLARNEGGLGIGLTLVRRVVELHGGAVRALSEGVGRGAEFVVRLPLAAATGLPSAPAPPPAGLPPRRILVVEDNDEGREMLVATLRLDGHEVLDAGTGREGLDVATRHRPDIVLVDIGLPDISGYEVGQRLRQALGGTARIVALTGYGQPHDRARSEQAGFDAHLVKPVDPPRLAEALQRLV